MKKKTQNRALNNVACFQPIFHNNPEMFLTSFTLHLGRCDGYAYWEWSGKIGTENVKQKYISRAYPIEKYSILYPCTKNIMSANQILTHFFCQELIYEFVMGGWNLCICHINAV